MKKTLLATVFTTSLFATAAHASGLSDGLHKFSDFDLAGTTSGFYVGGTMGTSNITGSANDIYIPGLDYSQNRQHFAYKLYGGYQFNRYVSFEAGYVDLGSDRIEFSNGRQNKISANGGYFDLVGTYPVTDKFTVMGKVGYSILDNSSKETGASIGGIDSQDSYSNSGTKAHFTYGVGLKYAVTKNIAVRADYDHFVATSNVQNVGLKSDMFSFGAQYKF